MSNLLLPYEIIRPLPGYENHYKISARGNIYSFDRWVKHKDGGLAIRPARKMAPIDVNGYSFIGLNRDRKQTRFPIHQLVARTFIENPQNKKCINHKDFDRKNNDVTNLEWATYLENMQHSVLNDRTAFGIKCTFSKLSESDVYEILSYPKSRGYVGKLAAKFNVSLGCISGVINPKSKAHWRERQKFLILKNNDGTN